MTYTLCRAFFLFFDNSLALSMTEILDMTDLLNDIAFKIEIVSEIV